MARPKYIQDHIDKIGEKVHQAILNAGYESLYDYRINCDDALPKSTLSDIVNGKSDPKISTLLQIARTLKIDVEELL